MTIIVIFEIESIRPYETLLGIESIKKDDIDVLLVDSYGMNPLPTKNISRLVDREAFGF